MIKHGKRRRYLWVICVYLLVKYSILLHYFVVEHLLPIDVPIDVLHQHLHTIQVVSRDLLTRVAVSDCFNQRIS